MGALLIAVLMHVVPKVWSADLPEHVQGDFDRALAGDSISAALVAQIPWDEKRFREVIASIKKAPHELEVDRRTKLWSRAIVNSVSAPLVRLFWSLLFAEGLGFEEFGLIYSHKDSLFFWDPADPVLASFLEKGPRESVSGVLKRFPRSVIQAGVPFVPLLLQREHPPWDFLKRDFLPRVEDYILLHLEDVNFAFEVKLALAETEAERKLFRSRPVESISNVPLLLTRAFQVQRDPPIRRLFEKAISPEALRAIRNKAWFTPPHRLPQTALEALPLVETRTGSLWLIQTVLPRWAEVEALGALEIWVSLAPLTLPEKKSLLNELVARSTLWSRHAELLVDRQKSVTAERILEHFRRGATYLPVSARRMGSIYCANSLVRDLTSKRNR